jgi:hypothetical protein
MNNPTASEAGKESQISDNRKIDTLGQLWLAVVSIIYISLGYFEQRCTLN